MYGVHSLFFVVGVGSIAQIVSMLGRFGPTRPALPPRLCPYGFAVGVGSKYPEPVALVRSSDIGRSQHHPFRIVPERGKVAQHHVESTCP
jgi:hypothetical protein